MAFSKKILRILSDKEGAIIKGESELLEGLTTTEKKVFKAVKKQLNKMNKSGGKFEFDAKNTNLVNELDDIIINEIQGSSYPSAVNKYLQNFDTVTDYNSELHGDLNDLTPKELKDLVDPFKAQTVEDTLQGLTGSGVRTEFAEPIRQELFKNIVAGANSQEIEASLRRMIEGDAERLGGLNRYVGQVTRDSLNQYDGQINAKIADEFGLDAFQYVGSLIEDSRLQCAKWVTKGVLLKEELPGQISWANSNGSGMIPGTTPDNFAVFRGGYNCRHSAIPFKMTKREREKYEGKEEQVEESEDTPEQTLDGVTRASKELNLTYGKSNKVPEALRGLGVPDQVFELSDNGPVRLTSANSFYRLGDGIVRVAFKNSRYSTSEWNKRRVVIHEYGHRAHAVNNWFRVVVSDPIHKAAFDNSKKILQKRARQEKEFRYSFRGEALFKKMGVYTERLKGQFTQKEVREMFGGYADTVEALTGGSYGYGHGRSYFQKSGGGLQPAEWFAHASENYFQGNVIFQEEFPELYEQMLDYFSKEVVQVKLKKFLK